MSYAEPDPLSFYWDFGNGDFSTSESPTYIYPDIGDFIFTVTVSFASGDAVCSRHIYIDNANELPTADFTNSVPLLAGREILFTDNSVGIRSENGAYWSIDGEDFVWGPYAVYRKTFEAGDHIITLRVVNSFGFARVDRTITVIVLPTVSFTASQYSCNVGDTITFTNTSTNTESVAFWFRFMNSGGHYFHGQLTTWTRTFTTAGYRMISLIAYLNEEMIELGSADIYIRVISVLKTNIGVPKLTVYKGKSISFTQETLRDSVSVVPDSILWNFGDGTELSGLTATHKYAKSGKYDVSTTTTVGGVVVVSPAIQIRVSPSGLLPVATKAVTKKRPDAFAKASMKARQRFEKARRKK